MKKALLLFICMMPVLGYAQSSGGEGGSSGGNSGSSSGGIDPKDVALLPLEPIDDDRHDVPVTPAFNAEVLPDKTVLVMSRDIATFSVLVVNRRSMGNQYNGQTHNGRLHFTTPLPEGAYNILVTCEGFSFTGDFTISAE